jgi:hypothetical protein
LEFIDLGLSIINLEDEVMDLFLEKLNDRIALGDHCATLVDLIFPVMNSLLSGSDDFIFLGHQGFEAAQSG